MARVLVVERNEKIGALISGQLRDKGYDAVDVRHGAAMAVELRRKVADVIVMDNQIAMGGVKTARILRLHDKFNTIPIILSLPPEKQEATAIITEGQEVGLKNFLRKPFTLKSLQQNLDQVLANEPATKKPSHQEIRDEIRNLSNLPVMPAAHSKLLSLLSRPDEEIDVRQVSATLEQDPALSATVMRACHSAYYGFRGHMMAQAVAFLGVATVRKIVQTSVIYNTFSADEESKRTAALTMNDLWRHSLATGMAMEIIGKSDKKKTHFLLGLLHDIGKAVFICRFPDHYGEVLNLVEKENISILRAEQELLGVSHAECGGELATHWDLQAELRTAISAHHSPGKTAQHKRLASMVHIADIAVRTMGIGYGGDPLIPAMDPYARRLLKSVEEIVQHKEDFVQQCDSILGASDGGD